MDLLTGTIKLDLVQSQFARRRMAAHIQAHEIAEYDCEHISLVPERVLPFWLNRRKPLRLARCDLFNNAAAMRILALEVARSIVAY